MNRKINLPILLWILFLLSLATLFTMGFIQINGQIKKEKQLKEAQKAQHEKEMEDYNRQVTEAIKDFLKENERRKAEDDFGIMWDI